MPASAPEPAELLADSGGVKAHGGGRALVDIGLSTLLPETSTPKALGAVRENIVDTKVACVLLVVGCSAVRSGSLVAAPPREGIFVIAVSLTVLAGTVR